MQRAHQVCTIIHGHLRLVVQSRAQVFVVSNIIFAFDGKGGNLKMVDQRCGDIILGRQRVRSSQRHIRPAGLERAHEVGRLGRHVQTGRNTHSLQRAFFGEALTDQAKHGHLPFRPFDLQATAIRQPGVFYIITCHIFLQILND